jgi:polynucleotide 5'-hydroxyl-kinase GRC3/NOL9
VTSVAGAFCRYPTVAYLETDVGQPEFTVPGMLSLHLLTAPVFGPPNMHLRDPEK